MSTEIESNMKDHLLVEYFGGRDVGVCLQVTSTTSDRYIQLNMLEAAELAYDLAQYAQREARRRQALLREQINDMRALEHSVFGEIADLNVGEYEVARTVLRLVDQFTPTTKQVAP